MGTLIEELREASDECLGDIDGGEECVGNDQRLSRLASLMKQAAMRLEKNHDTTLFDELG